MNEKIKKAIEMLEFFNDNKLYWLLAMVKNGMLTEAEAGYITIYHMNK